MFLNTTLVTRDRFSTPCPPACSPMPFLYYPIAFLCCISLAILWARTNVFCVSHNVVSILQVSFSYIHGTNVLFILYNGLSILGSCIFMLSTTQYLLYVIQRPFYIISQLFCICPVFLSFSETQYILYVIQRSFCISSRSHWDLRGGGSK